MTCSGAPLDDVRAVPHGPHLLRSLVAVTGAARTAEEFHGTLALHLAQVLDMHAVLVVELDGDGSTMRTHAAVIGGRRVPNFSYTLEDTPCESVHGKGVCVYRDEVAALFPKDKDLHEWGIRSYAGAPLYDSSGRPNGVIAVLGRRPIDDPDHVCELLTLFSHRAAAEMERQQALARLALTEERLRVAFDNGTMGIGVSDRQHIVDANGRLCGMLGYTADELRGRPWATITHPDDREASAAAMARFDDGTTAHVELRKRFLRKDGGVVHTHTRVSCHRDGGGEPRLFTCFVEDLTPALEAAAELNRLSTVDPVTGLLNRAQLFETLQRRLSQCPPHMLGRGPVRARHRPLRGRQRRVGLRGGRPAARAGGGPPRGPGRPRGRGGPRRQRRVRHRAVSSRRRTRGHAPRGPAGRADERALPPPRG